MSRTNQHPEISVLIPVRNAETTINASIGSVLNQSFKNWELIIVNDGSTDRTESIIQEFASRDRRIRFFSTPPHGIAHALNFGISHCQAQWIARMDADDLMTTDRLALQLEHAMRHPEHGVISGLVTHRGESGGISMYVDWLNSVVTPEEIALKRFIESPVAHPSVMFRSELVERFGGYFHGDFPEDYELWLRWHGQGVKFSKVPYPILTWSDGPSRLTRSDPRYLPEKFYATKLPYLAKWICQNVDPTREIWLWGAGRVTRKRFSQFPRHGIEIRGYIDIDTKKCGHRRDGLRVVMPDDILGLQNPFVVACVAKHGARELIQSDLESRGQIEGKDFIHAA